MISGNCNRSPQYANVGPGAQMQANQYSVGPQRHPSQLLFMAGGSTSGYPPQVSSRHFSKMPNGGLRPTIVQCDMQHGFGGGGYGYSYGYGFGYYANPPSAFHHQQSYLQQEMIHHQPPQHQYAQQTYIRPPPPISAVPTPGIIDGVKKIIKGFFPKNQTDAHSDNLKAGNPKYRNNYMGDRKSDLISCLPMYLQVGVTSVAPAATNLPKSMPNESVAIPSKKVENPIALFSSEDFPELPPPRRSRSNTPAKTEKTTVEQKMPAVEVLNQQKQSPTPQPSTLTTESTPTVCSTIIPKSTFFEIKCTTTPCGRRPTFGGRLKVIPPPFSLNKSCWTRRKQSTNCTTPNGDCDTEDESFEIFPKDKAEECIFPPFGACRRQRQLSECSDDSFVVFFTEDTEALVPIDSDADVDDDDDDDDDCLDSDEETSSSSEDEESDNESDEEDNGTDVVDSICSGRTKTDRNKYDGEKAFLHPEFAENTQLCSGFDEKKVTFNPNPVVHVMRAWNYAYRAARKGHWEDFARDRTRFQKRIERTSVYLNPILTPEHRERIYRTRFCDEANNQPQNQQTQQ